ncbi:ABC transporter permease [Aerophototrophica crusticola]|uniref:ABC transporter permease n=1 Tax=Aerophototrophica crusticola TaxID=1709002 RepID=A0A858RA10_9PROT|nr:ABC transporter permease [Rhodospirillaceae bacterium B3]
MSGDRFSPTRLLAMVVKEFIQMKRDRLTFAMMVGIPIIQLMLFGFAINSDPKHLPTAILSLDQGPFSRSVVAGLQNSAYYRVEWVAETRAEVDAMLDRGVVQFVLTIPAGFGRDLVRGDRPVLLLEADAADPAATGNAVGALNNIVRDSLRHDLTGPLAELAQSQPPVDLRIHRRYNPEGLTQYNIVPGLVGTILTMTMIIMTALAVTRERERGTMENLLAMPVRPLEVMVGKLAPFILVGAVQVTIIIGAARLLFGVPMLGSPVALVVGLLFFITANLAVGFLFSTLARNQLQAMQMSFFFFLPSILMSGFMFPFRGMPQWAQTIGEALPLTHFLRIVRGVMLKGNGLPDAWPNLWPLVLFLLVVSTIAVNRYRQTLD